MAYLNIIYFLILTIFSIKFLRSDGKVIKSGLNPEFKFNYSGPELFWCLTFACSLLACSAEVGMNLMAIRLFALEILCVAGLCLAPNKPVWSFPLKIFAIYLVWLLTGLVYSPAPSYGFRVFLKYLYPLLFCLFASAAVRDAEVFIKSSKLARIVGAVSIVFAFIPILDNWIFPGLFWYGTARAIYFISVMTFSLGMFFFSKEKKKNLLFTLLFLAPCLIWVFRTSIMGSGIAIMAFSIIRYRMKSLPIIAAVLVVGVCLAFFVPSIKEKMFYDTDAATIEDFQSGTMNEENFNTNYRAYMWERLERQFFDGHELAGSGTGAVQEHMYNNRRSYGNLTVPHSDFVQQKCDNGLIGLYLYGAMIFLVFLDCFRTYWNWRYEDYSALRLCAIVAGASLLGVYATFYSDNTVNYSMATLSMPFGFYGMMLGMRAQYESNYNL